jgi:hypothetical protein
MAAKKTAAKKAAAPKKKGDEPVRPGRKSASMNAKSAAIGKSAAKKGYEETSTRRANSQAGDLSGYGRPKFSEIGTVSFPGGRISARAKYQEKRKADKPASKHAAKYNIRKESREKFVQGGFYDTSKFQEALYPGTEYTGFRIMPMRSADAYPSPKKTKTIKKK